MFKVIGVLSVMLCLVAIGCQQQQQPLVDIAQQQAEALATKYVEIYNNGNMEMVAGVIDTAFVGHGPVSPEPIMGRDGFITWVKSHRDQFSDLNLSFERVIAKGDWVTFHWRVTGTNDGPMGEVPATGKKMDISGLTLTHVVNGKAVEEWIVYDLLAVYQQLGFTMAPPKPVTVKKK